ncbi:MAG: cytochrome c maturation protein CcmE [Chloroflexi bacterium]|nr:cytochrome c maturation protein CcmE [Chloroflexota bacterium]
MAEGSAAQHNQTKASSTIFTHRGKLLIAVALLATALGYFTFTAFQGSTVYYVTVSELQGQGQQVYGKTIRVSGTLVADTFQREAGTTVAQFAISDGDTNLHAVYDGALPDLFFNERSSIVLEGRYGADGVFHTDNVIVKCPSKYEAAPSS